MKAIFLLLLVVPLLEIYLLIKMGGVIGIGLTFLLVIATAILGAFCARAQGFATLRRVQNELAHGRLPALEVLEGMLLFMAGALLLTPGFVTDAFGFVLLVPILRRRLIRWVIQRNLFANVSAQANAAGGSGVYSWYSHSSSNGRAQVSSGRVIDADHDRLD